MNSFKFLTVFIPPPISYIISLRVVPIGTSTNPTLFIFPARAKTFVPFDFSVPMDLYQSAPLFIMAGIFAKVSTLFTTVGLFQRPASAGNGGL